MNDSRLPIRDPRHATSASRGPTHLPSSADVHPEEVNRDLPDGSELDEAPTAAAGDRASAVTQDVRAPRLPAVESGPLESSIDSLGLSGAVTTEASSFRPGRDALAAVGDAPRLTSNSSERFDEREVSSPGLAVVDAELRSPQTPGRSDRVSDDRTLTGRPPRAPSARLDTLDDFPADAISEAGATPAVQDSVRALRWFGAGKSLAVDEATGETFPVARLLPGERATIVRYIRGRRRFPVADKILEASPHRGPTHCPHYSECSGCDLLHATESEEQAYKRLTVREVLKRFAGQDVTHVETVGRAHRGAHRARARFALRRSNGAITLGLRGLNGELVDIVDCPASVPEVRSVMIAVRSLVREMPGLALTGVEVSAGVEGVAVIYEAESWDTVRGGELVNATQATPGVTATAVREDQGKTSLLAGQWPRQLPVGKITLGPAPDAWTQPTPDRAAALYVWVLGLGLHHGKTVLDATCGTGGLSIALAGAAQSVLGVDANWDALKSAMRSSQEQALMNTQFRGGKIQTIGARLLAAGARYDLVVVNPMRRSLGDQCMADLCALSAEHFLYLAPAPRAGAEDVKGVVARGFEIRRVASVNLHPGTSKALMAVLMSRPTRRA